MHLVDTLHTQFTHTYMYVTKIDNLPSMITVAGEDLCCILCTKLFSPMHTYTPLLATPTSVTVTTLMMVAGPSLVWEMERLSSGNRVRGEEVPLGINNHVTLGTGSPAALQVSDNVSPSKILTFEGLLVTVGGTITR